MSVASWFIAERAPAAAAAHGQDLVAASDAAARIAVLLDMPRQHGLAAVLGLALAREATAPAALVLTWHARGVAGPGLPARRAGRGLARTLHTRDLPVRTAGRLVCVELPPGDGEAAVATERAVAAAPPDVPVVIALGGPRGPALDALIDGADVIVVAGKACDPRVQVAREGAGAGGPRVVGWEELPTSPWRRLAAVGMGGALGVGDLPDGAVR